jgi:hypothetical protein
VAPADGTAVVHFTGSCCLDTLEGSGKSKARCTQEPSSWVWVWIDEALDRPWTDRSTFEVPNLSEDSLHFCSPAATSRAFAVKAGANTLLVNAKTNASASCSGSATVFFAASQLALPAAVR